MPGDYDPTPYELELLATVAGRDTPVSRLALVGWHLPADATFDDADRGLDAVYELVYRGFLTISPDEEMLSMTDEQKQAVAAMTSLRRDGLPPAAQVALLALAGDVRGPQRASDVVNEMRRVVADRVGADKLGEAFASLFTTADRRREDDKSLAYVVAIYLSNLIRCGLVRTASVGHYGHGYTLDPGQRTAVLCRREATLSALFPPPPPEPKSEPVVPMGRRPRMIDLS